MKITRSYYIDQIQHVFEIHPVCALIGPRQCGKTTLSRLYAEEVFARHSQQAIHYFDLEHPHDLNALESPSLTLEPLEGLIIIDEIQRRPDLFPYLRYLSDYSQKKILILGSSSRDLIHQSSETLAGRISYIEVKPFALSEVDDFQKHWQRGGFPKSYLASSERASEHWRFDYITTFLERDLATMGININPSLMRRLWSMIAHYHGQNVNYSEIGRSLNLSDKTVKNYLDILEGAFMVRLLKPWFENLSKRQVKSPKVYIRDSGILHTLLDISSTQLLKHPKLGASFEGYALEEIIKKLHERETQIYFWRTEKGAELDLLVIKGDKRYGFEFKFSDSPKITASMRISLQDLQLEHLTVITPGDRIYKIDSNITTVGLARAIRNDFDLLAKK